MPSRIRIKVGELEVEYEGEETYLKKDLPGLIERLTAASKRVPRSKPDGSAADSSGGKGGSETPEGLADLSTEEIAARLKVDSGPELVIAACARLTFGLKKDDFARSEIIGEMKSAKGHYRKSYLNNLSNALTRLTKAERLRDRGNDRYALPQKERSSLEQTLAERA